LSEIIRASDDPYVGAKHSLSNSQNLRLF